MKQIGTLPGLTQIHMDSRRITTEPPPPSLSVSLSLILLAPRTPSPTHRQQRQQHPEHFRPKPKESKWDRTTPRRITLAPWHGCADQERRTVTDGKIGEVFSSFGREQNCVRSGNSKSNAAFLDTRSPRTASTTALSFSLTNFPHAKSQSCRQDGIMYGMHRVPPSSAPKPSAVFASSGRHKFFQERERRLQRFLLDDKKRDLYDIANLNTDHSESYLHDLRKDDVARDSMYNTPTDEQRKWRDRKMEKLLGRKGLLFDTVNDPWNPAESPNAIDPQRKRKKGGAPNLMDQKRPEANEV